MKNKLALLLIKILAKMGYLVNVHKINEPTYVYDADLNKWILKGKK
jgi:hypothetical protein